MTTADMTEQLQLALDLARRARAIVLQHYSPAGVRFDVKPDGSPVTIADRSAEEFIRAELAHRCPADGVLGEEFGESAGTSNVRWVLDPVDGTRAFTHGVPLFGTMIAIETRATPGPGWRAIASVVDFPALDETCWAHLGRGARHQARGATRPIRASSVATLAEAVITMSTPRTPSQVFARHSDPARRHAAIDRLLAAPRDVRGWGDCHAHLMVAMGRMDAMINGRIARWDIAPLEPIVTEAGGRITGWDGSGFAGSTSDGAMGAVTTNGLIHDQLVAVLSG